VDSLSSRHGKQTRHGAGLPELQIETQAILSLPCFDVSFVFSMLWFGCSSSLATQQMQDLLFSSVVSVMLDDVVYSISMRKVLYFILESEFQLNAVEKR
jgi:hypothetical protein